MASVLWNEHTAEELRALAAADAVVLAPVASTEQHGPHLASGVDTFLAGAVCRRAAERLTDAGTQTLVLPTLWIGMAEHHMAFGGTLTVSLSTYRALILDICRSVLRHGFSRLMIVNGHGGNIAPLAAFGADLAAELGRPVPAVTYFELAGEGIAAILEDQSRVNHACEAETSMMMAAFPDHVRTGRLGEAHGPPGGSLAGLGAARFRSFADITGTGVIGDARRASAAKGEALLDAAAEALAETIAAGEPWA